VEQVRLESSRSTCGAFVVRVQTGRQAGRQQAADGCGAPKVAT
jgi:hypothetical protein